MTTRICIRLNDQEQAAFAKIKGKNDSEKFRLMLVATQHYAAIHRWVYLELAKDKSIKTSTRNGRHIGKKKPANY